MSNAGPADLGPVTLPPNGVENFPSYDDEDLSNILPTTGGRLESCSTAEVMSEETTTWEDEGGRVHFSIRFPDWVQGTRVSVDLGTGITSLESCWNVATTPGGQSRHRRQWPAACRFHAWPSITQPRRGLHVERHVD